MIINKIKRYVHKKRIKKLSSFFQKGDSTILTQDFNIRLDNPEKSRKYLTIGDDCIISGTFIFESKEEIFLLVIIPTSVEGFLYAGLQYRLGIMSPLHGAVLYMTMILTH